MARKAFFSFHFEDDLWRASVVRSAWEADDTREASGFWEPGLWTRAKDRGSDAVARLIDEALEDTCVTIVLIGAHTATRRWVRYQIVESLRRGNGLLGVRIHRIRDRRGDIAKRGASPFEALTDDAGRRLSLLHPVYDCSADEGLRNLPSWAAAAAAKVRQ